MASRSTRWWPVSVAVLTVIVALSACSPPQVVDAGTAAKLARDFVVAGQPSDYVFEGLTNTEPELVGSAWRIRLDALVRIPGTPPQRAQLHFIIDIDRQTGKATIVALG